MSEQIQALIAYVKRAFPGHYVSDDRDFTRSGHSVRVDNGQGLLLVTASREVSHGLRPGGR